MSDRKISETTKVLLKARELIEKPENWCQGRDALTKLRWECNWDSKDAVQFCARGALRRAADTPYVQNYMSFLYHGCLVRFNDHYEHAKVIRLFDVAIAKSIQKDNLDICPKP